RSSDAANGLRSPPRISEGGRMNSLPPVPDGAAATLTATVPGTPRAQPAEAAASAFSLLLRQAPLAQPLPEGAASAARALPAPAPWQPPLAGDEVLAEENFTPAAADALGALTLPAAAPVAPANAGMADSELDAAALARDGAEDAPTSPPAPVLAMPLPPANPDTRAATPAPEPTAAGFAARVPVTGPVTAAAA